MSGQETETHSFLTVLDFSGECRSQEGLKKWRPRWIDMTDLPGTNCYCDEEAAREIQRRTKDLALVRLLDSGNYHYVSLLLMEQETEPFDLWVFDHHTDAQPPAFGGLLSCGGWIYEALERLPQLRSVYVIGPEEASCREAQALCKERIRFISQETVQAAREKGEIRDILEEIALEPGRSVYLSVDKDVLCSEDMKTNWSQGDLRLSELLLLLSELFQKMEKEGCSLLAADLCGEAEVGHAPSDGRNEACTQTLVSLLKKVVRGQTCICLP